MSTYVTLKDGRKLSGELWEWRPQQGYFVLAACIDGTTGEEVDGRILLKDCASVMDHDRHTVADREQPDGRSWRDYLQRAREEGWDGT